MGRGTEGDGDGDGEWSTNGLVPPPSLRRFGKPAGGGTPRLCTLPKPRARVSRARFSVLSAREKARGRGAEGKRLL